MSAVRKLRYDCSLAEQLEQLNKPPEDKGCGPKNILVVEGSRDDRQLSENNTGLLERVWILSRPPQNLKDPQPTVSARRVQVIRALLDGDIDKDNKNCSESQGSSTRASSRSGSMLG